MVPSNKLQQLIDRKLRKMPEWKDLTWVHIQNVTDYYLMSEQSLWDLHADFANVAPPWPDFVTYFHHPGRYRSGGKWVEEPQQTADVLTVCRAIPLPPSVRTANWMMRFRIFNLGRVDAEMRVLLPVAADGTCPGLPAQEYMKLVPKRAGLPARGQPVTRQRARWARPLDNPGLDVGQEL